MIFLILCIINIGYNLILILIYFTSGILSKIFDLNKTFSFFDKYLDNNNEEEYRYFEENNDEFKLFKGIRNCCAIAGIYICFMFLMQMIELFKYHYNGMKERKKIWNKKIKYI